MPTVLRWNGYRFYFFSNERGEPAHVHIDKAGRSAKYWLVPVGLAINHGYPERELNVIRLKIEEQQVAFMRAWNEHLGD